MAANLTMVRIATKLDDLFNEKIDISDVKTSDDDRSTFYSRAIAALSIMIQCGIDETLSGSCVTDGYHDMGIDAVYNDSTQKKLVAKNIRYYKGSTDVNQGIKEVLRTEPEKSSATGRKRLVLVHGNRFLLHMILSEMKQYANYLTAFFDAKSLPELVNPLCQKYWELTFSAMEEKYPDAYPAHIFKNIGRLREIKEQICLRDSKSQEE